MLQRPMTACGDCPNRFCDECVVNVMHSCVDCEEPVCLFCLFHRHLEVALCERCEQARNEEKEGKSI